MNSDPWLERGFAVQNDVSVGRLLSSGDDWQLYQMSNKGFLLAASEDLYAFWLEKDLLPATVWITVPYKKRFLYLLVSKFDSVIASVTDGPYPNSIADFDAFVIALRMTREKLDDGISFEDAVYVEQFSVLLPTCRDSAGIEDKVVIGRYLSGGVDISVDNFERLCSIASWASPWWLEQILVANGFSSSRGAAEMLERKREEQNQKEAELQKKSAPKQVHRISVQNPSSSFSLPGRPALEQFFNEHVVEIVQHQEQYLRMGIDFPSAIVLHGPPGCGKTFAVEQLIDYLQWPSYFIDSGTIGSSYIHETSKKISEIFAEAIKHAPSVLVIDEMEAFLTDRSGAPSSHLYHTEEVAEFLRKIPEASKNHVLVIAMTNLVDTIDPAVLRRGRFDHIVEVKMPSAEEVNSLLHHLLSTLPASDDIDYEDISKKLAGRALSDVTFVLKEAGRKAVRTNQDMITNELLLSAVAALPAQPGAKRKIGF